MTEDTPHHRSRVGPVLEHVVDGLRIVTALLQARERESQRCQTAVRSEMTNRSCPIHLADVEVLCIVLHPSLILLREPLKRRVKVVGDEVDRTDSDSRIGERTTLGDESVRAIGDELIGCQGLDVEADVIRPAGGRSASS